MKPLILSLVVFGSTLAIGCSGSNPLAPTVLAAAPLTTTVLVAPEPTPVVGVVAAPVPAPVMPSPAPSPKPTPAPTPAPVPAPVVTPPPVFVHVPMPPMPVPPDGPCGLLPCAPPVSVSCLLPLVPTLREGDVFCALPLAAILCPVGTHPLLGLSVTCVAD